MIKRFFLADDDEDDTSLFAEALMNIDPAIEFDSAKNGKQLLEKLENISAVPEVIFLDINMPEMNGWEALKNLKMSNDFCDIPVIMYSTSSSIKDGKKAIESGALGFYEKPPSFLQLKDFLEKVTASTLAELQSTLKGIRSISDHHVFV
jgi:DNA-binding NtrC family response regulator